MRNSVPSQILQTTDRIPITRTADCPKCGQPVFCADTEATFGSHGFESYRLNCPAYEISLGGIVDPFDDAFLLSVG
jgi:hypothetical protein